MKQGAIVNNIGHPPDHTLKIINIRIFRPIGIDLPGNYIVKYNIGLRNYISYYSCKNTLT